MIESKKITNPFPGLRPFETDEYRLFFGREGQSDALIARLQRSHFLAVVGTSGSGKSSLVRAGLLPALRGGMMAGAGSGWRIAIMRPGSNPIGNLATALADKDVLLKAGAGLPPAEAQAVIEATLRRGSLGLIDVARQARLAEHQKLLVVVDQFEELFRFRAARAASSTGDDAAAFVKLLLEASQQHELSIYVVPTMRSDFLGDCAQFQGLPEAINDGQYLIPRMTRDERRFAITGPVGVTRGKISEPLVNSLMNDVGDNPDQLPILQHALMRTWDYWSGHRRDGEPIGLEHYEAVGTMTDALSQHADEAFNELPDERSRLIAEALFKALTERGADNREIRRPTCLKDICAIAGATAAEASAVIEVFRGGGRSFLMPPAGVALEPETVIDISHESLIRNWRRLMEWVKDEADSARTYRRLADAALDHRAGARGLLDDVTLQYVLNWRDKSKPDRAWGVRYHPEFDGAMAYLDESRAARDARIAGEQARERRELETARAFAEKQARSAHRMRRLTAALCVILLFALGTTVYAFVMKRTAEASETKTRKLAGNLETTRLNLEATRRSVAEAETQVAASQLDAKEKTSLAIAEQKKAKDAKAEAELETKRANEEKQIAAANLRSAEIAHLQAEENLLQARHARERGDLMRSGLEASRLEQSELADHAFSQLVTNLNEAIKSAQTREDAAVEDLKFDLGWALSNLGAEQRKLGKLHEAIENYEHARTVLTKTLKVNEAHLKVDEKTLVTDESDDARQRDNTPAANAADSTKLLTLFATYHGLAHAYHENAPVVFRQSHMPDQERQKLEAQQQENAKKFYGLALAFQQQYLWQKAELARGRINLARLYRDMGEFGDAERYYNSAVALQLKELNVGKNLSSSLNLSETLSSLREVAEFYRSIPKYDDSVRVYNQLIDIQQNIYTQKRGSEPQEGYVEAARDLANSFSDLADVYRAAGAEKKANAVFHVAYLIQKASLKFKSSAADVELDIDLDLIGDDYVNIGKFSYAEDIYKQALRLRENTPERVKFLWMSYDKLAKLYRDNLNDEKQAEEYNSLLFKLLEHTESSDVVDSMVKLAALYAKDGSRYEDAAKLYRQALLAAGGKDWQYPNLIHYSLGQLYLKRHETAGREEQIQARLDLLADFFKKLTDKTDPRPKAPITLVSEYLNAIEASAFFQSNVNKSDVQAETVYRKVFAASDYITREVYNVKVLETYASTLDHYQALLNKLKYSADAAKAAELGKVVHSKLEKLRQADEITRQQSNQQIPQSQTQSTSP